MSDDVTGHYLMAQIWVLTNFRFIVVRKDEFWNILKGRLNVRFFSVVEGFRKLFISYEILETFEA